MKIGPGGAFGFEKGLAFSQASKATLNSGLNLRTYSAASSSWPSSLAWIHVVEGRDIEETLLASQGREPSA